MRPRANSNKVWRLLVRRVRSNGDIDSVVRYYSIKESAFEAATKANKDGVFLSLEEYDLYRRYNDLKFR